MSGQNNHIISAAIDFGTTFSGYAFSSRNDFQKSHDKVSSMTWTAGTGCLQSLKTSTCVLFSPDKKFSEFGFQAEDKYSELAFDEKEKGWYFFRRFKMELYKAKKVTADMKLKSIDGKTLPALDVFSAAIGYMKNHLLKTCSTRGLDLQPEDIQWVLTVPAIWDDSAKLFMRKAALKAGILTDKLLLALEPEAAAMYCKSIHVDMSQDSDGGKTLDTFKSGTKYMVLDAGGGTVDITVHKVQDGGTLREVCAASGGDWGGTQVDEEFKRLLTNIFGQDVFKTFQDNDVDDFLEMLRNFEVKKRTLSDKQNDNITFSIPASLLDIYESANPTTSTNDFIDESSGNLFRKKNKLRMSTQYAHSLFKPSTDGIVNHLKAMMRNPRVADITSILLVGGYSDCSLLHKKVTESFPYLRVIVPPEAGLAVLKGAVITGHTPSAITHRVCRYTYGLAGSDIFQEGVHDEKLKRLNAKGISKCDGIFHKQVTVGDVISVGHKSKCMTYHVREATSTSIRLTVYTSTLSNPRYTQQEGSKILGSLEVDMSDTTKGLDRGIGVQMIFGGSEIKVEATNKYTGETQSATFDFI